MKLILRFGGGDGRSEAAPIAIKSGETNRIDPGEESCGDMI